jgi:molybdopterin converting factor small subunit
VKIKARVYATLRRYVPEAALGQPIVVELPPAATIGDVLDRLGIPRAEARVCFVAGIRQELDYQLRDDDELALFPPVAGGGASTSSSFLS